MVRTVAFIPLRGGSKSIPLKNIRPLAGKPLAMWVIEAALQAAGIDQVVVATDSDQIRQALQIPNPKLKIVGRSPETATDTASTESALLEFAEANEFSEVILVQATSPLLTAAMLEAGLKRFQSEKFDSLLSVVRQKRFIWKENSSHIGTPVNYDPLHRPRRQDFDGYLVENGAFYVTKRDLLLKSRCRLSGKIGLYEMPEETFVEIDEPSDWLVVEKLLQSRL